MVTKHTATLTAFLILGIAAVAKAQQSASDTTRPNPDRPQDQRALATDTMKLHLDRARLDSALALLHQGQAQARADTKQLDSLKAVIKRDRQATPRDTAAIAQDQAQVVALRKQLDTELDRARREKAQVEVAQKAVRRESHAAIEAHQDIRGDSKENKPRAPEHSGTVKGH